MTAARPRSPADAKDRSVRAAAGQPLRRYERDLVTPEGTVLKLRLATASERAGAVLIDFLIIFLALFVGLAAIGYAAAGFGFEGLNLALALASVFVFAMRNFYFIAFELGRRSATPGKRVLGLRVAARNGGRLSANAVFARNFLREVEVYLPLQFLVFGAGGDGVNGWIALLGLLWSGLFLFFPVFNRDKLRAGDLLAGTWVIHAPKIRLDKDVSGNGRAGMPESAANAYVFTPAQVGTYGIHELHVLEDVLRKSAPEVRSSVAERIRKKIGWQAAPGETDLAFLEAYYAALRRHLEQKLLLGTRKIDKFDAG